jgi:replicative DNA helicase
MHEEREIYESPGAPQADPSEFTDPLAEQASIALLMMGDQFAVKVLSVLSSECYAAGGVNFHIFKAAEAVRKRGETVALLSIRSQLELDGKLEEVGDTRTLQSFQRYRVVDGELKLEGSDDVVFSSIENCLKRVKQLAVSRKLAKIAEDNLKRFRAGLLAPDQFCEITRESVTGIDTGSTYAAVRDSTKYATIVDTIHKNVEGVEMAHSTGFPQFDQATGGLRGSDVVLVNGLPKGAKSVTALTIANHYVRNNEPAAIVSMEMTHDELIKRRIAMNSQKQVDFGLLLGGFSGHMDRIMGQAALDTWDAIHKDPLHIITGINSTAQIMAECERLILQEGVILIVIDYLQLVKGGPKSTEERLAEVTAEAKRISNKYAHLGVSVIVCSQLNAEGIKETKVLGRMSSDQTYGTSASVKDCTIVTNIHLDDPKFECDCQEQTVEGERKLYKGREVTPKRKRHDYKPPNGGLCEVCNVPVRDFPLRGGGIFVEYARNCPSHTMVPLIFEGKFMHVYERPSKFSKAEIEEDIESIV